MFHPLMGSSFKDIINLIKLNGDISISKVPTIIFILLFSLLSIPSRRKESKLYDKKIAAMTIPQPIFIIGHWRSGTTHLHNILSKDPQFNFFTTREVFDPRNMILANRIINLFRAFIPKVRPMDNVAFGLNEPQEDEFALCNLGVLSAVLEVFFLKNYMSYIKYLSFKNATPAEIKSWKEGMITIYKKKVFLRPECTTILSKNPCHTSKIQYLLELFPQAKFIHIYRNPYKVYLSTAHAPRVTNLQNKVSDDFKKKFVFTTYHELMEAFFKSQPLIPKGNFVEIRYEDLTQSPLEQIEKIYLTLNIDGFGQAKNKFHTYLNSLKNYKKNIYKPLSKEMAAEIYSHLAFTIDKWGYSPDQ